MVYDHKSFHYNNQRSIEKRTKAKAIRSSTMTKTEDDAHNQQSSGIPPFTYTKEEWPTDQPKETVTSGTCKRSGKVSSKMKVLNGTEIPEMLMMWKIDLESKVCRDTTITTDQKLTILLQLVVDKAQTAVNTAIALF